MKKKNIYFEKVTVVWFEKKLIHNEEEKVRDHCHLTGKFRGGAHWDCNINLKLTKNVRVIFHNFRGYDSHLIFSELDKFDVKTSVVPNGLEKYMVFFFNKILVFIGNMKYMNSSLDKLVKNLPDEEFKYLVEEFCSEDLELLQQKVIILTSTWTVLKDLMKKNYLLENIFTAL